MLWKGDGMRLLCLQVSAFFVLSVLISHTEAQATVAAGSRFGVAVKHQTFLDKSRSIEPALTFAGSADRRVDVVIWYPGETQSDTPLENGDIAKGGPWPLVLYGHGTYGYPSNATHFVYALVKAGYIVVAPVFPLTSRVSFSGVPGPVMSDVINQPRDLSFVIDQLLADASIGPSIDSEHIGSSGHSLGAVTSYFASYGASTRDPRIKANAMIGAGDPVQAALSWGLGFDGVQHAPVSVPALFLSADKDVFANMTGRPHAAYSRIEPPKYEVLVRNGNHIWFRDGNEKMPDGRNPDCLFFDTNMPGNAVPGCQQPVQLIEAALQQEITRVALLAFFDGYLKGDTQALARLKNIGTSYPVAELRYQD